MVWFNEGKTKSNVLVIGTFHLVRTQFNMLSGPTHPLFACNTQWKYIGGLTPPPRFVCNKWKAPYMRQHYDTQIYVTVEIYTGLAICKVSGVNLSLNLVKKKVALIFVWKLNMFYGEQH